MTKKEPRRARSVRKLISFSEDEWAAVEQRMVLAGASSFDHFARTVVLDGEVKVRRVVFDPSLIGAELSRIGNNINQIARLANTEDVATVEQLKATRVLVQEIQALIERASKAAE